jgi:hypothetical protein
MRNKLHIVLVIPGMIFLNINIMAQTHQWNTKILDKGKITVKYRISKQNDALGQEVLVIEDSSSVTENIDFQKCITLLKNVSGHKEFTGDKISKKIKDISENECIVYYYAKNPWPIANSDCVSRMIYHYNAAEKTALFQFTAAPTEYAAGDVNRMTNYNVTYSFRDLGGGLVEIIVTGKTSPPVKVPMWMIKSAFPGVPAKALRKIVSLTKE